MSYADDLLGYGDARFVEVFFREFRNKSYGFCSSKPAKTISVFGTSEGRLTILQPNQDRTTTTVSKSVVTVFIDLDIDERTGLPSPEEIADYKSEELSTAYWDRENQELITKETLKDYFGADDAIDDSQVHYASV